MNETNTAITNRTVFSDRCNAAVQLVTKLLLYVIAAVLVVRGDITLGTFIAVIAYFETADTLLAGINKYWVNVHANLTIIDSVIQLLEMEEETDVGLPETEFQTGRIWMKNVDYKYGERKVLDGFSLMVQDGEKIAIVGKSGAGKSTIVNILLKLLEVKPGYVEIDGYDICDISIKSIRRQIGIVHQETAVFEGTVRENLLLANSKATESDLWRALRCVGLEDYVKKLPEQLDAVLGVDGLQMSGGETQRLSVARIFLKNVKILIMDEATSALDAETEYFVNRMCGKLSTGKTVIMIAHRLSTVLSADKVAVLENGKLAGYGTSEDLYENNACYRALFEEQYRIGNHKG